MIIQYKDEAIETVSWEPVTEEERLQLQNDFFSKPEFSIVLKQLQTISKNGVMMDKITRYYFRDIMAKTKIKGSKWTVEDIFNSADLLGIFKARTKTNNQVFDSSNLISNIETAIRLGGHSIAGFPPNFPMKTVRQILNKYNINNNWYDFSCGWGVRLLGALSRSINYYGTDPNYLLTERLQQLYKDYSSNILTQSIVDIKTQGSEIFVPEWENQMGLAFSSPPYFDIEDYQIGAQSYNPNISYEAWQTDYLLPTIQNIYRYLIADGIFALNIKNNKQYKLADDAKILITNAGFHLIDIEILTNNQRITPSGKLNNAENIFIFKKKHNTIISILQNTNTEIDENKKIQCTNIEKEIIQDKNTKETETKKMNPEIDVNNIKFNDLTRDFIEDFISKMTPEEKNKLKQYIDENPRDSSSKLFVVVKSYIYRTYFKKEPIQEKKKILFSDALNNLLNLEEENK